ncbi:MAG: hypothetical protein ACD_73C00506G0002 [uncultured bacterium]|nr:MAG: hypothetical protein ACD_73C00506G0002 [uncultured bacterium]
MQETINFCTTWLDAWTGNQPEKLISFYSRDAFYRDPAKPLGLRGHEELLPYFKKLLSRNPNWIWKAQEIFPTEKGFILKWEATIPLKDKTIIESGMDIVELKEGKIVRNEVYFDTSGMK